MIRYNMIPQGRMIIRGRVFLWMPGVSQHGILDSVALHGLVWILQRLWFGMGEFDIRAALIGVCTSFCKI
jgi:hypothetical protein